MEAATDRRRGYLHEDFRIFHLKDADATRVDYHYHEFHKLVLLLSGTVTYFIEDISYTLKPGDLLVVPRGVIHKPLISTGEDYERYVIWATPDFLARSSRPDQELSNVFDRPTGSHLLSLSPTARLDLMQQLTRIEQSARSGDFAAPLLTENLFSIFMISVNRLFLQKSSAALSPVPDDKTRAICRFIDEHLSRDLSVERLSSVFYTSRYHLMRTFKAQTGQTLHQYITRRRILKAAELISNGTPVAKAASACGYEDYSAFLRAFKSIFKVTPKHFTSSGGTADIEHE
ncbi:MAG: helix-turn-helix domain-containing protein [Clostridia bacterium]|nr:helix-turn-helix domain-containing protein [Clostridia bacterium]